MGYNVENTLLELPIEESGSPVQLDRTKNKQNTSEVRAKCMQKGKRRGGKRCRMKA